MRKLCPRCHGYYVIPCSTCNGRGQVWTGETRRWGGETEYIMKTCPTCQGRRAVGVCPECRMGYVDDDTRRWP